MKLRNLGIATVIALLSAVNTAVADVNEQIKDWTFVCQDASKKQCLITQNVIDEKTKDMIMSVSVAYLPKDKEPSLIFNLPAQANPKEDILMVLDKNTPLGLPIEECKPEVCMAIGTLNANITNQLKTGQDAGVHFKLTDGTPVTIKFSLNGFSDAYQALAKTAKN